MIRRKCATLGRGMSFADSLHSNERGACARPSHMMKATLRVRMAQKLAAVMVTLASTTFATAAQADEPRGVDWTKVLVELDHVARGGTERPNPNAALSLRQQPRPAPIDDPNPQSMGNAWFGV